jgi:REP element-mobilizing transposase RayT
MPRIKVHGQAAVYHCISRIVGGQFLLKELEREKLRQFMWNQAEFAGVQIVTYAIMINHIHVLIRIPEPARVSDQEILKRCQAIYAPEDPFMELLGKMMKKKGKLDADLRKRLLARMGDVSFFMKELKERFSRWYNKQFDRFGTLWAERFKSVLIENKPGVVQTLAGYIDLNPVRVGLVQDPKDYRHCGYAEAVAGGVKAREGILSFHDADDWKQASREYRKYLFIGGGTAGHSDKVLLDPKAIQKVLDQGGELSEGQLFRLRIRYMTQGAVLGSRNFVNEDFTQYRKCFGPRRKQGGRPMRFNALKCLYSLRDVKG